MGDLRGGRFDSEGRWARVSTFPMHWGAPPTFGDSLERRDWIADNARRDSRRDPARALAYLEERREDPETVRLRAAARTRARLLREELAALLLPGYRSSGRR